MTRLRRFLQWLRPWMPYLNIALAAAAWVANTFLFQVFCHPVLWAEIVLLVCIGAFLCWPWLAVQPNPLRYAALFLQGALVPIGIYCVLFVGPEVLILGIVGCFLVVPALVWIPVWFMAQATNRAFSSQLPLAKAVFGLGMLPLLLAQFYVERQYQAIESAVAQLPRAQRKQPAVLAKIVPRTYVAERLAGALFKYHNYEEVIFDGWRPPLHDPLVNISLWLRSGRVWNKGASWEVERRSDWQANPLLVGQIGQQARFYHQLFPQLPVKADCVCARNYDGESYLKWQPLLDSHEADSTHLVERAEFLK